MVEDVRVLTPDGESDVYLRLVSVDPLKENPINGVHLTEGVPLKNGAMEIWVDSKFFAANNLKLNHEIEIIAEGRKRSLRVVGAGQSPEFIYAMRDSSDIYPDPEKFGIAYIPLQSMQAIFSHQNTVNSIIFTLQPGAAYSSVEQELEPKLKKFGLENLYPRKDQTSDLLLTGELKGIQAMSTSIPVLFVCYRSHSVYHAQTHGGTAEGQLGISRLWVTPTKKYFALHDISFGMRPVGGIVGGLGGCPVFSLLHLQIVFSAGTPGSFHPGTSWVYSALPRFRFCGVPGLKGPSLHPAGNAPPAPPSTNKTLLEKAVLSGTYSLSGDGMRNILHPGRTFFVFWRGVRLSLGGMTWTFKDISEQMLYDQYEKIEKYSAKVSFLPRGCAAGFLNWDVSPG